MKVQRNISKEVRWVDIPFGQVFTGSFGPEDLKKVYYKVTSGSSRDRLTCAVCFESDKIYTISDGGVKVYEYVAHPLANVGW